MALRQLSKTLPRMASTLRAPTSSSYHKLSSLQDNPFQYTNDGEKIYCGYKVTKGKKEETGEAKEFVESAQAKAFDDSLNSVIHVKYDDNRDSNQ